MGHTAHLNVHTTAYLPLVKTMTQTKSVTKAFIPGTQSSVRLTPKGTRTTPVRNRKERTVQLNSLQRKTRHLQNLYLKKKQNAEEMKHIDNEYDRAKDEMAGILDGLGLKEIKCDNSNLVFLLKERSKYQFEDDIVRLEHELKAEKQIAIDTGKATKDTTVYISPYISK